MKIPIQLKYYLVVLLFAVATINLSCYSKPSFVANLKTEIPEDPYADDGLSFRVFCYHDVRDNLRQTIESRPERSALDTYDLIQQFEWLRESGYHVVSLDAVLAARNGGPKLPDKALLLSFDDGYCSMYTRVFPLLKLYNYPAILSLVGEFMEEGVKAGIILSAEGLQPSSTGARVRFSGSKRTVIDGPFAETKELIAGYMIIQVKSREAAIEWTKRFVQIDAPGRLGAERECELRQLFEAEDFGAEFTPELREQEERIRRQAEQQMKGGTR